MQVMLCCFIEQQKYNKNHWSSYLYDSCRCNLLQRNIWGVTDKILKRRICRGLTNQRQVFSQEYDQNTLWIKILEIQWMLIVHCQRGISGLLIPVMFMFWLITQTVSTAHSLHWSSQCYQGLLGKVKVRVCNITLSHLSTSVLSQHGIIRSQNKS